MYQKLTRLFTGFKDELLTSIHSLYTAYPQLAEITGDNTGGRLIVGSSRFEIAHFATVRRYLPGPCGKNCLQPERFCADE